MAKSRKGTHYNILCPYCNKMNHYVCQGIKVLHDKITPFEKICQHCKKMVYYQATYEIAVEAFCEDPLKNPKKPSVFEPSEDTDQMKKSQE